MNRIFLLLLTGILLCSFQTGQPVITVDKEQALLAFKFLNDIRSDPKKFRTEFAAIGQVKGIRNTALIWNDTLAKVAEQKALDMARRNYFGHVDPDGYGMNYFINAAGYRLIPPLWTSSREKNNFESIAKAVLTGPDTTKLVTGIGIIRQLVIDKGTPSLGHRKHLLGLEPWGASLTDIGIGIVRVRSEDMIVTYTSVLIAKHNW